MQLQPISVAPKTAFDVAPSSIVPNTPIERAISYVDSAYRVAEDAKASPRNTGYGNLMQGARIAQAAADLLRVTPPRSDRQDLPSAVVYVEQGAAHLRNAALTLTSQYSDSRLVASLSSQAVTAFDNAYKILYTR